MDGAKNSLNRYSNEAVWLVKSGDIISGPFTTDEIKLKIRSKEVVVIDEVSLPMSRWRYVRDEPAFSAVVEEIRRGLMQAQDNTEVQGYTRNEPQTATDLTGSESASNAIEPAVIVFSQAAGADSGSFDSIQDAEYTDVPNQRSAGADSRSQVRQYGVSRSKDVKKSVSRFTTLLWVGVFAVLGGVGYYVLQTKATQNGLADTGLNFSNLLQKADAAWTEGDFTTALTAYKEANSRKPLQPAIVSRLAVLTLKKGGTVEAKRLLLAVESHALDPASRFDVEMALGLAALAGDDASEAAARFRQAKADASVDRQWIADFNGGVAAYLMQAWDDAIVGFRAAGEEPVARLMLARSLMESARAGSQQHAEEAEAVLKRLSSAYPEFRQETLVVRAFLDLEKGRTDDARTRVAAAFDIDPDQTANHFYDPFLSLAPMKWTTFVSDVPEAPPRSAIAGHQRDVRTLHFQSRRSR